MKKILFIDRDGTLVAEPEDEQVDAFEKINFLPNVMPALSKIAAELDYELVMVTNQDGLGTEAFPESDFWPVHNFIIETLASQGIRFSEVCIDKSYPEEGLDTRKPGTGMLRAYLYGRYDLENSFVVGDRVSDVELADNLGSKSIFIGEPLDRADLSTTDWWEIYQFLKEGSRKAQVQRKTNETEIEVVLDLNGKGKAQIETGLGFYDHMLEQIARHAQIDLRIRCKGDLQVDEHHSIEDTALALGEAFRTALGSKKGIQRYGFVLPMDDALAQVAIDFGGRPWLEWDVTFSREKIGDVPTEMFFHFFKSFADTAQCNLNIKAEGGNEHHMIESIFKGLARSIRQAIASDGSQELPSTKGSL